MKPIVCVITFALGATNPVASTSEPPSQRPSQNRRISREQAPTAQEQSNAPADVKLTQTIRRALVKDATLSTSAKNVQIITIGGKVTLRGSVQTTQERARIAEAAKQSAGTAEVDDQLEVENKP